MKKLITILLLFSSFNIYAQQAGNALDFDGTNDYANGSGISTSLTNITLEAWVYHHILPPLRQRYVTIGNEVAVIRHDGASQQGQLHFYVKVGGSLHHIRVDNVLQTGQWYHVVGTLTYAFPYSNMKLYLNGEWVGTKMNIFGPLNTPNGNVQISRPAEVMDGYIDEVRIWNDARSPEEIRANMYKTLTGTETGLENYWMFNESSGSTAYDNSGSVNLTLNNMYDDDWVTSGAFTGPRNTLDYDGSNDYVQVNDNSTLDITDNLTIEAWIKADSWETNYWEGTIVAKEKSDKTGYNLRCGENGRLSFVTGISGSWPEVKSSQIMSTDTWYHVCGVYDGASQKIYINGELVGENNASGSVGTNDLDLFIGSSPGYSGRLFDGKIEEVRIWNDVRTPAEIRENMCQTLAGNESGLVAYYRFDQEEGTTLYDITSNNNNGTLTNMADEDWVGSTAFNTWIGCYDDNWNSHINWSRGIVPNSNTENVGFPAGGGSTFLSGNFTCNNLIIGTGSNLSINSGSTLTISNSIINAGTLSGDGLLKLSGRDSAYELNGIFSNLELDDTDGAMLTDNLTINGTMTLTNGTLSIGDNTLFFNGLVSTSSGSLSGGSSSNITFGGSGASTLLPVVSLGNLTINRTNGIWLIGDVTIDNTLTLTDGTLSIGANTLTLNGAISTTSGSLSGGSSSNITFGGSGTGTYLPAVSLGKLIINRSNGIGLAGDVTIDDTLKLTDGALSINVNTLTLNGAISTTSGSLSGGSSSNIIFGGSGASTSLPAVSLGNLTVNRANGIGLIGDVTIDNTLTLANGQFYVGSNTLTIKNAIAGTPANLVAGITSSITISGSGSGVNIPSSVSALNNMLLDNSNGTILQSDLLIDGTLTLTSGVFTVDAHKLTIKNAIGGTPANLVAGITSSITIAGSGSGVNIPSSVSDLNNMLLDNSNGTILQSDLLIDGTMTLTNGALSIGANTLFINGAISTTSGSLSGGSSSNINFGGSGESTDLPAVSLGNLTINQANGIGLIGDVTIDSTLILTNGQFTVGSNTLTIKNTIVGTPANLVAGITSSITIAGSGSGVNIPSSVSVLNNMGLDNSNGTILQSNLLINGTMTLTNGTLTTNGYALSYGPDGTLKYNGTSLQTTTSNEFPSTNNPKNLIINNAAGVNLAFNRTIDSTLILTNGDLDLNGDTLTLGVNATLSESVGNTVKGETGILITTRTFNDGDLTAGVNIAGMGADIMTNSALGETTIIRGHAAQNKGATESILRYFDISPANNSGLDARLIFNYDNTELNGITAESQLELFRSTDAGNTWSREDGEVSIYNNTITLEGIDAFSRWTAFNAGFIEIVTTLDDVYYSSVTWGDYDNDGDLDILLTGQSDNGETSRVYRNDSSGTFTDINAGLPGVEYSSAAWGDYDNDGDLDILLTGQSDNGEISCVYRNDGYDNFTDINAGLTGVEFSSVAWGDYDNDGDLDILLTGKDENYDKISRVYRNDGSGIFTDINAGLPGVINGSVAWGDYDKDGDLDILLTGMSDNGKISRVYRNDDSGTFIDIDAGLPGVWLSSAAWGDFNNDGNLDILLTGRDENFDNISCIYRGTNNGNFYDINAGLPGVDFSSVAWGDYDNDGDLDILLTGKGNCYSNSCVYRTDGYSYFYSFTDINAGLTSVELGSAAWGDYDNDGDLDILLTGWSYYGTTSRVYRNDIIDANTAPGAPTNLSASVSGQDVTLDWDKATDNETPQDGLTYNLRIGTSSGGVQTASPMADVSNGYRKVAALGNTNHNNSWDIYGLIDNSTYYWSVQAVDNAFAGSAFATEGSFVIPDYPNISTTSITNITTTTASSGGNVTDEGTFPVTVKGIVWDTCKNPTVDTYTGKTNNGSGLGSFISSLTGLAGGQTYYVRAYATNSEYTAYGGQKVFATPMKPPGNALDFDGIDDYVGIPDNGSLDLTDSLTIEAWIKADLWKANIWEGSIIVKDGDQSGYMLRCGDNGKVNFNIGTGAWNDLTTDEADSLSLNIWYHIAATYDGTTQKIYVNGVLVKEQSTSGAVVVNPYSLMIGKSPAYPDRRYAGKIDEVRIWNIARNSVQIRKNMHRTLNGDEDNLVAYYRFDHISGTALSDRTSNDNDGTLHNMDDTDWVSSTAPIPYFTVYDGNWEVDSVWAAGQNAPVYQWSRVKIKHNITLNSNMELLELIIDTNAIMTISTGDTLTVGGQ